MSGLKNSRPAASSPSAAPLVTVDRLAAGGDGVGRIGAKVAFIPLTAPGDLAEVEVIEQRRTWCRARVARLVRPGRDRVGPRCPAFGVCGGCDWQHLSYPAQLSAKGAIVEEALRRIGRLDPPAVGAAIASPQQFGYRHRARLQAAWVGGAMIFGFFRRGSRKVVALETCAVLHPALDAVLAALAEAGRRHSRALAPLAQVRVDTGWGGRQVRLLAQGAQGAAIAIAMSAAGTLRGLAAARGVRLLLESDAREPLPLGPGPEALVTTDETFTQVNLRQNTTLVDETVALASPLPGEEVLDLCCGLGNLALPVAARGCHVTGVDRDGQAVLQARENARRLGLEATFFQGDAAGAARSLAGAGRCFGLVLLNPPRAGARETMAVVPTLSPTRVVVVSCDPATLARDAAALAAAGYHLAAVRALDLFPQTSHVETIALFRRSP